MASLDLRLGWVGFHQEGLPAIGSLLRSGVRFETIVTLDEGSLEKRSAGVDYSELAAAHGLPLQRVRNINDPAVVQSLSELKLDVLFVIGWSQLLHPPALATARLGVIGAHASLLPHNRGSAPINWALINGETSAGNTLMWLTEGVDEGRIIDQMSFPVTPYDTCATLYDQVAETNRIMIERTLPKLVADDCPGIMQPHSDEPILPRRRPDDGRIDWSLSSHKVYNFVRALTRPYPGAFSHLEGTRWTIQTCALLPGDHSCADPGTVTGSVFSPVSDACGQLVACGTGAIVVLELESQDGATLKGSALSDCQWTGKVWTNE
jgi:methionyl-tRNA formyltransferase